MRSRTTVSAGAFGIEALEGRLLLSSPGDVPAAVAAAPLARVTGHVFDDVNGNGVWDAGEEPVANAAVTVPGVFTQDRTQFYEMRTNTNDAGEFELESQVSGLIVVRPGPSTLTVFGNLMDTKQMAIDVADGQTTNVDVPVQRFAMVIGRVQEDRGGGARVDQTGVRVYLDENNNGKQDAGEPEAVTDGDGYRFDHIPPGKYRVGLVETLAPYLRISSQGGGVAVRGKMVEFSDLLITRRSSKVSGLVFRDSNGNGVRDKGEEGLAGVRVHVDSNGDGVKSSDEVVVVTDATGRFSTKAPVGNTSFRFIVPRDYAPLGLSSKDGQRPVYLIRRFNIPFTLDVVKVRVGLKPQ